VCDEVRDEEWPGGMGTTPKPPEPPGSAITPPGRRNDQVAPAGTPANPWDVASELSPAIKQCLMGTEVENPYNGVLNTYVQITSRASSKGLTQIVPQVMIKSLPKDLQFNERRGWVTQADMRRTELSVESCITRSAESLSFKPDSPLNRAGPSKVWLLFASADVYKAFLLP
jgi:hypothetical protein